MLYVIIGLIVLACILLWVVILVQNPKGGGLSSQFGGSSVTNIIGAKQSVDVMEKATWIMGTIILVLVLVSSYLTTPKEQGIDSSLQDRAEENVIPPTGSPQPVAPQGGNQVVPFEDAAPEGDGGQE